MASSRPFSAKGRGNITGQDLDVVCGLSIYLRFLVIIIVTTTTQCSVFHYVLPFNVSVDILL